jgi:hypothetical protein
VNHHHDGENYPTVVYRRFHCQEDWLIIVVTDHGGKNKSHHDNIPIIRTIFLIVSGPSASRGMIEPSPGIVDVAATALTHLGIPIDPAWDFDGKPVGLRRP